MSADDDDIRALMRELDGADGVDRPRTIRGPWDPTPARLVPLRGFVLVAAAAAIVTSIVMLWPTPAPADLLIVMPRQVDAVAVLLNASGAYASELDPEAGDHRSGLKMSKAATERLFGELPRESRTTLAYYNEEDFRQIIPWTSEPYAHADSDLVKTINEKSQLAPQLLGAIAKTLALFDDVDAERRALVIFTDEVDRTRAGARGQKLAELLASARARGVEVYVVQFTLGQDVRDLPPLCRQTGGAYLSVPFDETFDRAITEIVRALNTPRWPLSRSAPPSR